MSKFLEESRKKGVSKANKSSQSNKTKAKPKHNRGQTILGNNATLEQVLRLKNYVDFLQKTGFVVHIIEEKHPRVAGGILKLFGDRNPDFALFCPSDNRVPRIKIPMHQCPPNFFVLAEEHKKILYLAWIRTWNNPKFALGDLLRDIGLVGEVKAETESMLLSHMVDYSDFPDTVYIDLPKLPWSIPHEEIVRRTDLRAELICTIDPATARDLDDALSCKILPNGDFEVGVHIADVSYFIPINSNLDQCAAQRATSVYLTETVIPMLPRPLCEDLCSLNPGEDRLTFSVIWVLDPKGNIKSEWFGKTVIRSCIKMSYEHAQKMLDDPQKVWQDGELPIVADSHSVTNISRVVNQLNKLAMSMRKERVKQGALRLDQVKVCFSLDQETKRPNGVFIHEQKDSNRLIEEFMLLANMSVARKIFETYPEIAVLRKHPEPLKGPLLKMVQTLKRNGIHLDVSTSGTLHSSIQKYIGDDQRSIAKMQLIVSMCSRPMQLAQYCCSGAVPDQDFRHYALSVSLYTHFTSPIRRYADLMVHRLLASAVHSGEYPVPIWIPKEVAHKTQHCNDKKKAAGQVQEISTELYLALLVRELGEMVEEAIVIGVLDKSVDVLLLQLGVVKRCYTDKLPLAKVEFEKHNNPCLILHWKCETEPIVQKLTYFDTLTVILKPFENKELKFNAFLTRPNSYGS